MGRAALTYGSLPVGRRIRGVAMTPTGPTMQRPALITLADDGAIVVSVSGRLVPRALLHVLRDLAGAPEWIVLNLAGVPEIDAGTFAAVGAIRSHMRRRGTHLVLWHLRAQPHRLLHDLGLHHLFSIATDPLDDWLTRQKPQHGETPGPHGPVGRKRHSPALRSAGSATR